MDVDKHLKPPEASQDPASLVRRLAGPSTTKAGLAKDQTEINRIIAEASKGSKFYENEKRKDKDLTERIDRILKQCDELTKGVDKKKVEATVDQLLVELELKRDLSQIIVHVDMDAFYANVELLDNPNLAGKPFGVGSLYGVLTTASYDARKFGARSGMPGFIAKKLCPELIFVENHFSRYSEMSGKIMAIFRDYDPNMLAAGCDEGYLNITDYCNDHCISAEDCVRQMRERVCRETKLTVSAGVAPNKMLAKICSDKNKPNGQFQLPFEREAIVAFMRDLSIRKIPGIGRVNERLLESIGIKTCGDIFEHRATVSLMDKYFGLRFLLNVHLGIGSNVVQPWQREERKSIGAERTFASLDDKDKVLKKLDEVAAELESDMRRGGWVGRTVTLKYKLDTYQVFTRAKSLDRWVSKKDELYAIGKELLLHEWPLKLRLIGLRVTKLKDLKASEDRGIKRYFDASKASPSNKKRKVMDAIVVDEADELVDIPEDSMPGFHEHEYEEAAPEFEIVGDDPQPIRVFAPDAMQGHSGESRPRPPVSAPSSSSQKAESTFKQKPRSTADKISKSRPPRSCGSVTSRTVNSGIIANPTEQCVCPVCQKTLEVDNDGFNAHIDFCLSRGAILEAQVESLGAKLGKGRKR